MKKAYFASGCFWGTEYYFERAKGVIQTRVGFMGGHIDKPSYQAVCQKNTGHLETVEITYNPELTTYEALLQLFFETHDFTQVDGQGPDIGPQYLSCIFYADDTEKSMATDHLCRLKKMAYQPASLLKPVSHFWPAEDYHQHYYDQNGSQPYCHKYTKIF